MFHILARQNETRASYFAVRGRISHVPSIVLVTKWISRYVRELDQTFGERGSHWSLQFRYARAPERWD